MIDIDLIQKFKVSGIFLQIYKICTGTLQTLFIPQSCEVIINNTTENRFTLEQNYRNSDLYHKKTMYWNILTMTMFRILFNRIKRENWSIKFLDIDNDKPDNGLKEIIVKEKKLDKVDRLNKWYYNTVMITASMYFIHC